jgi:hypothetical protein
VRFFFVANKSHEPYRGTGKQLRSFPVPIGREPGRTPTGKNREATEKATGKAVNHAPKALHAISCLLLHWCWSECQFVSLLGWRADGFDVDGVGVDQPFHRRLVIFLAEGFAVGMFADHCWCEITSVLVGAAGSILLVEFFQRGEEGIVDASFVSKLIER